MRDTDSDKPSFKTRLGDAAALFFGLLLTPILFIFFPRFIISSFKTANQDWLSGPEHRHRLTYTHLNKTPMTLRHREVEEMVELLVEDEDWFAISDLLKDWDQAREKCPGGMDISLLGLQIFTKLTFNPYTPLESGLADRIATLAAAHPDRYPLTAMAASLLMAKGWAMRGGDYAHRVSNIGWDTMNDSFEQAEHLMARFDPQDANSAMLAAINFRLLDCTVDADKKLMPAYLLWSTLDPAGLECHSECGFKLLPRWYGDLQALEMTARQAALRTEKTTGMAAYYMMFTDCFNAGEDLLSLIDPDLFTQAVHDRLDLANNDPAVAASVLQAVDLLALERKPKHMSPAQTAHWQSAQDAISALTTQLFKTRLTAIYGLGWEGGTNAVLDQLSDLLREDMDAGAHFIMDENGIRATPAPAPEPEPMAA